MAMLNFFMRECLQIAQLLSPRPESPPRRQARCGDGQQACRCKAETPAPAPAFPGQGFARVPLHRLAWGRSGIRGSHAHISIVSGHAHYLPFIVAALTPEAVCQALAPRMCCVVERSELPDLGGLQFKLHYDEKTNPLSERTAKSIARMVLDIWVPIPWVLDGP